MSQKVSLKEAERRAFKTSFDDGLWDVLLGCIVIMFAGAPLLSTSLGDFWSSAVFLPFWGFIMLAIRKVRSVKVVPRLGRVEFSPPRKKKLMKFNIAIIATNLILLILGIIVVVNFHTIPGLIMSSIFGLIILSGFSIAAYFLDFARLYIYGMLVALSPLVGELLFTFYGISHHGFPLTFGISSGIIILTGLVIFIRFLCNNPPVVDGPNSL